VRASCAEILRVFGASLAEMHGLIFFFLVQSRSEGGLASMKASEWVSLQKALVKGFPDWHWHGRVWTPLDENGWEVREEMGEPVMNTAFENFASNKENENIEC
jgi:hypothetical protein